MTKTPEAPRSKLKRINDLPAEMVVLPPTHCPRIATKRECAEFFDVSIPAVDAWIRRGMPYIKAGSKTVPWEIDLLEVAKWRFAWRTTDGTVDPDSLEPAMRLAWYKGEAAKCKLQDRERGLIPADELERDVLATYAMVETHIHAIPARLSGDLGMPANVVDAVSEMLNESLDGFRVRLSGLATV